MVTNEGNDVDGSQDRFGGRPPSDEGGHCGVFAAGELARSRRGGPVPCQNQQWGKKSGLRYSFQSNFSAWSLPCPANPAVCPDFQAIYTLVALKSVSIFSISILYNIRLWIKFAD